MARPVEVAPGVFHLPLGILGQVSNGYIWISDEGPVVIDAGPPGAGTTIIDALTALDYRSQDVVALLVTHGDFDHVGGLAALKQACDAPVVAAEGEVALIEGRVPHQTRLRQPSAVGRVLGLLAGAAIRVIGAPDPVTVDVVLTPVSDTSPGGLRPIPTPGHTAGHTSYLALQAGILFAGDALRNQGGLSTPPRMATEDMAEARRSIKQLAMLSFGVACFGHGSPITQNADEKIRRLAETLPG
ncbi:MAG: putative metallo-hydrolase YflN [Anaerolineales bacterium]|nr:putative metallo-hydrolase YflN [Anaerolineales bacterium]